MTATIEMVSFKLNADASDQAFLDSNPALEAWVAKQPGFQYRALSKKEDGTWVDLVFWESLEQAQQAGTAFMAADEPKAMLAFIDKDSVSMQHMPVLACVAQEQAQAMA
ncbi:MAG: hypothetical protein V7785_19080 [Bermanella sp.]